MLLFQRNAIWKELQHYKREALSMEQRLEETEKKLYSQTLSSGLVQNSLSQVLDKLLEKIQIGRRGRKY